MAPNQNNCAVMLLDTLSSSTSLQNFPRSLPLTNTEPQLHRQPPRLQQQDSERQLYLKSDGDDVVIENNNEPIVAAFGDYMKWDDDTDENDASQTMQGRFEDEPERSNPQHSETLGRQFVTEIEGSSKNITTVVASKPTIISSPRRSLTQNTVSESSRNDPYDKNDFVVAAFGDYMDDDDLDDW